MIATQQSGQANTRRATADGRLLEFLVCPATRGPLHYDAERQELICRSARLAYPIRDGIPIMVPDEARHLDAPPTLSSSRPQRPSRGEPGS